MDQTSRNNLPGLILASASPRRKELLQYFGCPFTVRPSFADEEIKEPLDSEAYVQTLAGRKATEVSRDSRDAVILGADTIVVHHDNILGKPEDINHARSMIKNLSGSTHDVLTGVSLLKTDETSTITRREAFYESTRVTFGPIHDDLIEDYLANGNPLDKAGGYGIQDKWGAVFTKRIDGDFYNVMGLPVHKLYQRLRHFSPEFL